MRFSIPTRLNMRYVFLFVAFVFVGQLLEGTTFPFAVLTGFFTVVWALAFNQAGGLDYPSGAYILSAGLFTAVLGFGIKVLLGQKAETNLKDPLGTMTVYCAAMAMILVASTFSRALRAQTSFVTGFKSLRQLKQAAIFSLIFGFVLGVILSRGGVEGGSVLSALRQVNGFPICAILFATTYEVQHTGGKRSVNWIVVAGISTHIINGLLFFGKESLLIGFFAWAIAASIQGYQFKRFQVASFVLGMAFMVYYLVPYSQYVRSYASKTGSVAENIPVALSYLKDLNNTRRLYYESVEGEDAEIAHLYDNGNGFLERLVIVPADDALISFTNQGHVFGLAPIFDAYANAVPRIIYKDKRTTAYNNVYAHEMGGLSEDDTTTGIAFTSMAETYHQAKWIGTFFILPVVLFINFILFDSITGSARSSPFSLLPILMMFKAGSEGGTDAPIHLSTYGVFVILVIVWTTKFALPFVLRSLNIGQGPRPTAPPAFEGTRPASA